MPKQLYKINQFHGGLNSNSDPRDIADNELSEATDIMVDELGKIRLMGGIGIPDANYHGSWANPTSSTIKPGYGLFQFSHDRIDGHTPGGTNKDETGADYLVFGDADTSDAIYVYSDEDGVWGNIAGGFTNNTGGNCKFVFYFVDGVLRICDADFGNTNTNQWYGYVYRKDTMHPNALTVINLGSETVLVTNDRTFAGAGNWAALNVTPAIGSGLATITTTTTLQSEGMQLSVTDGAIMTALVVGKRYRVSADLDATTGSPLIQFSIGGGVSEEFAITTTPTTYTKDIKAINTTGTLQIYARSYATAEAFTVDDVSVKEIGASAGALSIWKLDNQYPSAPTADTTGATLVEKSTTAFDITDVSSNKTLTMRIDGGAGEVVETFALDNENYDVSDATKNYTDNICSESGATAQTRSPFALKNSGSFTAASWYMEWPYNSSDTWDNFYFHALDSTYLLADYVEAGPIAGETNVLEIPRDSYYDTVDAAVEVGDSSGGSAGDTDHLGNVFTAIRVSKSIGSQASPVPTATITWDGTTAPVIKFDIYVTSGHPILDGTKGGMSIKVLNGTRYLQGWYFNKDNGVSTAKLASLTDATMWGITADEWCTISLPITDWTNNLPSGLQGRWWGVDETLTEDVSLFNGLGIVFQHPHAECTWGLPGTANPNKHLYIKNFRTETDSVVADKALRFYYAWKYDDAFYTPLAQLGTSDWNYNAETLEKRTFSLHVRDTSQDLNERITGASVYFRQVGAEDDDSNVYKLAELDFQKGYKIVTGDFKSYVNGDWNVGQEVLSTEDIPMSATLPTIITYEMDSGHDNTETDFSVKFSTAVIANRMAYIGNIQHGGQTFGDRILKSNVNQFDNFPITNIIEASIADGDEIIKLEEYADRLLEFKKTKMTLINISQEVEFVEDTFMHKGVSHPAATCKTDFGIAWVNAQGCYLYDGQKVNNLLEKAGRQVIKEEEWDKFLRSNKSLAGTRLTPMIGYLPKKRQLIVFDDITTGSSTDPRMYLYDMVTQSWVKGSEQSAGPRLIDIAKTNFITDWNGDLVYAHTTGTVVKWNDASQAALGSDLQIATKDIDFGNPGQKKTVHKVYVTYKGASDTNVNVYFDVDGGTSLNKTFQNGTNFSSNELAASSSWAVAELKPTTSSQASNIYSFQLKFLSNSTTGSDFEINDISIVYRLKGQR